MRLDVSIDSRGLHRRLQALEARVPKVIERTLNTAAFEVRQRLVQELRTRLDSPKPWVTRGVRYDRARLIGGVLTASVYVAAPQLQYLRENLTGGVRGFKSFEARLRQAGLLPDGMYAIPGAALQLDAYGSPRRAALVRILRALVPGGASPSKRRRGPTRSVFALAHPRGGLAPGVWQKIGDTVRPLLLYTTDRPNYRVRVDFVRVGMTAAREAWPRIAERELRAAVARVK